MKSNLLKKQIRKALGLGVVFGLASSAAQAGVVAYSYLDVQNIRLLDTTPISITSVQNSSSSSAGFFDTDGILRTASNSSQTDGLDVLQACVGDCGFDENAFAATYDVGSSRTFLRGDAILTGGITTQDGAGAITMSEAQLGVGTGSTGGLSGSGLTNTSEFVFTAQEDGTATLEFDILSTLYVESTANTGFARANISWSVQLFRQDCFDGLGCLFTDISSTLDLSDPRFNFLANQQISVEGIGSAGFSSEGVEAALNFNGPYSVSADLIAGTGYKFEIRQSSLAEAKVPVPATIALIGLGFVAAGVFGRRRKSLKV